MKYDEPISPSIPTFYMLVGLPASGKSTLAETLSTYLNDVIILSSDKARVMLYNDINDQTHNQEVFDFLHKCTFDNLSSGKSVIFDATNISYKKRTLLLNEINNVHHIKCNKVCYLIATPYENCLINNKNRDSIVPDDVIKKMYLNFDVPYYYEGWDDIRIIRPDDIKYNNIFHWLVYTTYFDQKNHHYTLTLSEHCGMTAYHLMNNIKNDDMFFDIGFIHDCGKPFTQVFKDSKGNPTEEAHYYNHERVGAYDSLFFELDNHHSQTYRSPTDLHYNVFTSDNDYLYRAALIRWHMIPYVWEKDNNEKLKEKYKKLWGDKLYSDIMRLHEADKLAH